MKLEQAQRIAQQVLHTLQPFCDRIEIAGSIRRQCEPIGDIEIVLSRKTALLYDFKTALDKWTSQKGEAIGKYTQRLITVENGERIYADIFMPLKEDYYRQLAIRTGPADFSHHVIANKWTNKKWVGTDHGLRKRHECMQSSVGWKCIAKEPTLPPAWKSEREFFEWLGIKWMEPWERGTVAPTLVH